ARLTDLAKRVDGHILATAPTVDGAAEEERTHWVAGRALRLRGRDAPTSTYRSVTPEDVRPGPSTIARRVADVVQAVADLPSHRE
ncbi:MAG: adenylate/guanylate cyclase domain-containing protein, partial [Actinobacteria bacterium]|nr:adenylate/guanylate cyclase domain-containing protein [Actinomycetota bacterium]